MGKIKCPDCFGEGSFRVFKNESNPDTSTSDPRRTGSIACSECQGTGFQHDGLDEEPEKVVEVDEAETPEAKLYVRQLQFVEWLREKGIYNTMESGHTMRRMHLVWEKMTEDHEASQAALKAENIDVNIHAARAMLEELQDRE